MVEHTKFITISCTAMEVFALDVNGYVWRFIPATPRLKKTNRHPAQAAKPAIWVRLTMDKAGT